VELERLPPQFLVFHKQLLFFLLSEHFTGSVRDLVLSCLRDVFHSVRKLKEGVALDKYTEPFSLQALRLTNGALVYASVDRMLPSITTIEMKKKRHFGENSCGALA